MDRTDRRQPMTDGMSTTAERDARSRSSTIPMTTIATPCSCIGRGSAPSVAFTHELPAFERRLVVVGVLLRPLRELYLVARHLLVGNQLEQMRKAVEARTPL